MNPGRSMQQSAQNVTCAEARSGLYQQFAQALSHPDESMLDRIFNGELLSTIMALASRLPYSAPFNGATTLVSAGASRQDVGVFYTSHFQAGSQAISLRESGYSKLTEKALMEEVFRFYQHFGLNVAKLAEAGLKELPDHLCVQLEFLHYMTYLEANALRSPPATANLGALRRAQCDFVTRHPGSWINALTLKLTQADSTGFYRQRAAESIHATGKALSFRFRAGTDTHQQPPAVKRHR